MTTALAIVPQPPVIEFRRCTGHCCDPLKMSYEPGYFQRWRHASDDTDVGWCAKNLIWLGWRPPSMGGWSEIGTHEYRCKHFDKKARMCLIYGTGKRTRMCRTHPDYGRGPWEVCSHERCTRRTVVMDHRLKTRLRFPDLRLADKRKWAELEGRPGAALAAPECQAEMYEE